VQVTFGVGSERVAFANAHIVSGSERNDAESHRAKIPGSSPAAIIKSKREALLNVVRKCKVELADAQAISATGHGMQPLAIIGGDFNLLPDVVQPIVADAMTHFNCKSFDALTAVHAADAGGRDWIFSTGGLAGYSPTEDDVRAKVPLTIHPNDGPSHQIFAVKAWHLAAHVAALRTPGAALMELLEQRLVKKRRQEREEGILKRHESLSQRMAAVSADLRKAIASSQGA
jgi:hypothetical protein